ncbi:MAG: hypothetical protein R2849_05830 [Thermomicrobiales bacterium]
MAGSEIGTSFSIIRPDPLLANEPSNPTNTSQDVARWRPEPGAGQLVGITILILCAILLSYLSGNSMVERVARAFWLFMGMVALIASVAISVLLARLRSIRYAIDAGQVAVTARAKA